MKKAKHADTHEGNGRITVPNSLRVSNSARLDENEQANGQREQSREEERDHGAQGGGRGFHAHAVIIPLSGAASVRQFSRLERPGLRGPAPSAESEADRQASRQW